MVALRFYFVAELPRADMLNFALDAFGYHGSRDFEEAGSSVQLGLGETIIGVDHYTADNPYENISADLWFTPAMSLWIEAPDAETQTIWRQLIPVVLEFLQQSDGDAVVKADHEPLLLRLNQKLVLNSNLWTEDTLPLVPDDLEHELIADIDIWLIENIEE